MSVEEVNKAAFRRVGEIFNKGDLSLVDAVIASDYIYHGPGGQESKGREGFRQIVTMIRNSLPDLYSAIEDMIAEGDRLAARLTYTGTHTGELMGIAATGKKFTMTEILFVRFEGGKEVEAWGSPDMLSMYQQLGISPPGQ